MREIKFIPRPKVMEPCPDCRKFIGLCAKCKSDIAWAVWCRKTGPMATEKDLWDANRYRYGKNWIGEDGMYL